MADRLRLKQGRSYSVERAVHVADEKEPDIRLRGKPTDASVLTEIKVAESWSLEEFEEAFIDQLCRKYLRARVGRHGILLLVHQAPKGWRTAPAKLKQRHAQRLAEHPLQLGPRIDDRHYLTLDRPWRRAGPR